MATSSIAEVLAAAGATLFERGWLSANNLLMQFQADILGVRLRRPKYLETTSLGAASSIRVARLWAAKPPNTTEWIAPMRAQASMATAASGIIGM